MEEDDISVPLLGSLQFVKHVPVCRSPTRSGPRGYRNGGGVRSVESWDQTRGTEIFLSKTVKIVL